MKMYNKYFSTHLIASGYKYVLQRLQLYWLFKCMEHIVFSVTQTYKYSMIFFKLVTLTSLHCLFQIFNIKTASSSKQRCFVSS